MAKAKVAAKVVPAGTKVKYIPKGTSPKAVKRAIDSVVNPKAVKPAKGSRKKTNITPEGE